MAKAKGLSKGWMIGIGIIAVLILLVMWYIGTYNALIKLNEEVNNKWAQVETQYQRRVDLIPNLVATVSGAKDFEQSTLTAITAARSQWGAAQGINEKVQAANGIESALARLLVVVENYPDLKSNTNFLALQDELANTENKISVERGRYNDQVRSFNARIKTFPSNIVAGMMGYSDREYFQSAEGAENAPVVSFE